MSHAVRAARKAVLPLVLILVPLASAACSSGEAGTTVVAATSTAEGDTQPPPTVTGPSRQARLRVVSGPAGLSPS